MVSSRGTLGCFLINSNGSNTCIGTTQRRPSLKRDSENKVCSTIQMVLSIYINKGSVCAFCYAYIELRMYAKRPESRREG